MLKKILFTALVILLVYLVVRWRQKKMPEVATQASPQKSNSIYYLAGSVVTLMVISAFFWFSTQ